MRKGSHISTLLRSKKTVFSSRDIALLWGDPGSGKSRVKLNYYVKTGELYRIRKGLYAKDKHYDRLELATRIFTPAYVSFETVLARAGVVFQYYERIFVASYLSREVICDDQTYAVRKIKAVLLTNPAGSTNRVNMQLRTRSEHFWTRSTSAATTTLTISPRWTGTKSSRCYRCTVTGGWSALYRHSINIFRNHNNL